jgi:hypothetical protein
MYREEIETTGLTELSTALLDLQANPSLGILPPTFTAFRVRMTVGACEKNTVARILFFGFTQDRLFLPPSF